MGSTCTTLLDMCVYVVALVALRAFVSSMVHLMLLHIMMLLLLLRNIVPIEGRSATECETRGKREKSPPHTPCGEPPIVQPTHPQGGVSLFVPKVHRYARNFCRLL